MRILSKPYHPYTKPIPSLYQVYGNKGVPQGAQQHLCHLPSTQQRLLHPRRRDQPPGGVGSVFPSLRVIRSFFVPSLELTNVLINMVYLFHYFFVSLQKINLNKYQNENKSNNKNICIHFFIAVTMFYIRYAKRMGVCALGENYI